MILEVKLRFSSDFQTLTTHQFPLYFLYELLMTLRRVHETQRRYLSAKNGRYLNCYKTDKGFLKDSRPLLYRNRRAFSLWVDSTKKYCFH